MRFSEIELEDAASTAQRLQQSGLWKTGLSWLITGAAGFIGSQILLVLDAMKSYDPKLEVTALEVSKNPNRQHYLDLADAVHVADVRSNWEFISKHEVILQLASVASPTRYREQPLETLESNFFGTRNALRSAEEWGANLLIMSSSEIYGDPESGNIPTSESYRGNVSCTGPRACYDEGKRVAETLASIFQGRGTPVSVARPFNFYGPGMALDDGRVVADFARAVVKSEDITIFSDGSPTRSFCYIADAVEALLLMAITAEQRLTLNVGDPRQEISMSELAQVFVTVAEKEGLKSSIVYEKHPDSHYLADNPSRRCPDVSLIRSALGWEALTPLEKGIQRMLRHSLQVER